MEKTRRRGWRKQVFGLSAIIFAASFIVSLVPSIRAIAEGTIFKIKSAEITQLSSGVDGAISSHDDSTIVSDVTFHKLGDTATYKVVLQNTDSKDHVIETISDDNANSHVSYSYDKHANETITAGSNLDFVFEAKYAKTPNTNERQQVSKVKFSIRFTDIDEPEEVIVAPSTYDGLGASFVVLAISSLGLIVCAAIYAKNHKKAAKVLTVALVAALATAAITSVKAATVEVNSFTLTNNYGFYDKVVIKNGDKDVVIDYGQKLEDADEITEPTKPGYTFDGWEDENGNPVDPTKPIMEDITIKPKFVANTYTVKFDANGGNGTMAEMQFTYDEAQALAANAFDFTGREYTGWDTKANGSGVHYDDEAEVKNLTTENNGIVTLYAQWSVNPFHINYDGNGATSGEMATTNCEYDQVCQLRDNAFEKYGYDFAGWKYNDTIYADKADVTNIIDKGTITMVAQWTPHVYTITYTGLTNEEAAALRTAGNPDSYTIESPSFTLKNPEDRKDADGDTRERFVGWVEVIEPSTSVTLPMVGNLGDKTFNAVWETVALPEYDITYNYDDGNVATANPTKLNKEQSATLSEPVKTGYTFTGWTGTTISGDTPVKPYTIPAPHQKGDLEYTAHYRAHTYTVNFDINTDDTNVSGTMQPLVLSYDEEKALTVNAFTRTGYTFAGWKLGDNEYTDGQTVKNLTAEDGATITLKAQWTPTEYTIIFHANNENVENPDAMAAQVVTYDVETTLNPIAYTWWQHKFVEWTTNTNGTGTKYADKAAIKNLDANGGEIHLYAKWREIDAALDGRGSTTNKGINTKLKAITTANPDAKNFLHYPNGEPSDEIKASATDLSGTIDPIYAWVDGENIYWWSEDVKPRISTNDSVEYHYYGVGKSTAEGNVNNLEYMDLTGFDTTGIVGARSPFEYTNIRRVDISDWDLSNATDMSYFAYHSNLEDIIFPEHFDIQKVTSLNMAFAGAKLKKLDFRGWKTRDLNYLTNFIQSMPTITEVTFGGDFKTDNVTSMSGMINANANLATINNINTLNTAKVTSMRSMFDGDAAITSLDLSAFDTTALTDMAGMFKNMSGLTSLTLKGSFTAANVTNMEGTFYGVKNINTFDLSNLVSKPTNLKQTFAFTGGGAIETIDISNMDLSDVTTVEWTFFNANSGLKTIYTSSSVNPEVATNNTATFQYDTGLVGGANTHTYDVGGISSGVGSRIDDPDNGNPGYFTIKGARYIRYHDNDGDDTNDEANYALMKSRYLKAGDSLTKNAFTRRGFKFAGWKDADNNEYTDEQVMTDLVESKTPLELFAQWSEITATLNTGANVNNALRRIAGDATSFEMYTAGTPDFSTIDGEQIISANNSPAKVYAWQDAEAGKIYWWSEAYQPKFNANSASMFAGLTKLTNIDLTDLNASTATDLSNLYKGDTALVSTNITAQDTSNVTNMNSMFMNTGFTELSLEGLETNNVTDMANMFNGAKKITTLDVTPLNTEKVTTMSAMFANTTALGSINLTGLDTSSVTNMSSMFSASSVSSINLASFDTTNVIDISSMFKNTANLTTVDLSPLEVQSVTTMASLFEGSGITSINVAPLATESVTDMSAMFKNTLGLTELNVAPLNTTNVTTMKDMFYGSYHLASLDVSMLNTANVQNMSGTFGILGRETVLKMYDTPETTKFTTSNVTDMSYMFRGDRELNQGLVNIDLSHIDTSKVTNMSGMFIASRARSLDFSHFDTRKVTNMSQMFFIAPYLSRIDLSAFETPELKNVNQMFYYDGGTGASVIDMRNFDFSNANLANLAPYGPWGGKTYYMGKFDLSSTTANTEINLGSNGTQKIYVNTEYDPSIALERNIKVRQAANGMNGTVANNTTRTYAEYQRIDDPAHDAPGFFWIENPLVVSFDAKGGTASRTKYSYIPDTDYGTLPTVTNGPEGKVFAGWYTAAEGGEKVENGGAFASNEAHTLYAQWIKATSVLKAGSDVNIILKSINPNVVSFVRYNGVPDFDAIGDERVISLSNAVVPTYAWSNDNTIYWWSEAETVYLNENSGSFFKNLSNLTTIEQATLDTSKVKNMDFMFQYSGLVDFTFEMDTSNVMSMDAIFANCSKLERLDLSHVDTSKVTNMHGLVADAQKLTYLNLDNFSTASATNLESMFSTVKLMTTLDLTSFDTRNVTNMGWMISYITNLQTVYATDLFVPANNLSMPNTLVGGAGSRNLGTSSVYARIDDPDNGNPGYFTMKGARYIRYHDNDDNITNDEANYALMTSGYLKAGGKLKKNTFVRDGYVFTGWKDADDNEYTDEQVMADLTESKTPLELYAQWDPASYTVTFNANGGEVLQSTKTVTYLRSYGELPTPVKYDYANSILGGKYSFKEWNTKADGNGDTITPSSVYENTDDITLYAIWNDQFTVTIYNGESETPTTASYGIDDIVYLNAQNVAGKQFLYWEVDGAKKSYLKDYSMRMFQGKDLTIRAVYGSESDLESQQPGTYISDIYRQYSDNRIVVRSYSYVPDGYEIVKAGVVATLDADIANGTFDDQTATYPRAASVNGSSDNYYYTWSKGSVTSEQTVYVKAYLIYKDADGVEHTIYGDLVTATLTE